MGPDSLIELIGHARVRPDGTYTAGRRTDVRRATLLLSRERRYRYDNVALRRAVYRDFYAGSRRARDITN